MVVLSQDPEVGCILVLEVGCIPAQAGDYIQAPVVGFIPDLAVAHIRGQVVGFTPDPVVDSTQGQAAECITVLVHI